MPVPDKAQYRVVWHQVCRRRANAWNRLFGQGKLALVDCPTRRPPNTRTRTRSWTRTCTCTQRQVVGRSSILVLVLAPVPVLVWVLLSLTGDEHPNSLDVTNHRAYLFLGLGAQSKRTRRTSMILGLLPRPEQARCQCAR